MALVIFFVPEPSRGVAEMVRVTRPGGLVSAYAWDRTSDGFPWNPIERAMAAEGVTALTPIRDDVSALPVMRSLWIDAGLIDVETMPITVQRGFSDFDAYWSVGTTAPGIGRC